MKCANCGAELPEGSKFCGSCGTAAPVEPVTEPVVEEYTGPKDYRAWTTSRATFNPHMYTNSKTMMNYGTLVAAMNDYYDYMVTDYTTLGDYYLKDGMPYEIGDVITMDDIYYFLAGLTSSLFWCSIYFSVFNFLPIYPLDGFNMWDALDRRGNKVLQFLRTYGSYILLGLIAINILADYIFVLQYINLLGFIMNTLSNIVAWPITTLWGIIFGGLM